MYEGSSDALDLRFCYLAAVLRWITPLLCLLPVAAFAQGPCLRFGAPLEVGALSSSDIVESSGLAASVHQAGVRYTHNDSGDTARIFAFGAAGEDLGVFAVDGAAHVDWEDLALGPCARARACLFIGDVGDNAAIRQTVEVLRVAEPEVGVSVAVGPATRLELTYPDGPRDVEALLVDPVTSDLFLVEKSDTLAARVVVLRGAGDLGAGPYPLEALGVVEVEGFVTGGDFDPTGAQVVLRTYGAAAWRGAARRDEAGRVVAFERLDAPAIDGLGEAVTWRSDGLALLTTREGAGAPLYETPCLDPDGATPGPAVGPLVEAPAEEGCGSGGQAGLLFAPLLWARRRRRRRARPTRVRSVLRRSLVAALFVVALAPAPAAAEVEHQVFGAIAGGVWPAPNFGGHGVLLAEWRAKRDAGAGSFTLQFNTDTLRARFDDACFGPVCLGAELTGQLFNAGLLPDYYRRGERISALELSASYVAASAFAELRLPDKWFVRFTTTGRRWFFGGYEGRVGQPSLPDTESPLLPPPEAWVAEQALAATYWQLEPDRSQWEPHRLFMRVRGLALGVRGELHVRSEARGWGESTSFADQIGPRNGRGTGLIDPFAGPLTARNAPDTVILFVRQWARYGAQVTPWFRAQVEEQFGWGRGEDDLTRARIGGLNPYVVPVGGAPWAAFLSGRYVSGRASGHFRVFDEVEAGAFFDAVAMPDILRDGDDRWGGAIGAGAFVDARFGEWQGDLWVGYAPGLSWGLEDHYVSVFLSIGRTLW